MSENNDYGQRNGAQKEHSALRRGAVAAAVGAALATGGAVQAAGNPFAVQELPGGYMVAAKGAEGRCAGTKKGTQKDTAEGRCAGMQGESAKGAREGSCAGMKKGEERTAKGAREGSCAGNRKEAAAAKGKKEGRCGEGKCGNRK